MCDTVEDLVKVLLAMPQDAPVALRTVFPQQAIRWEAIERVELRAPEGFPPVVLIR